MRKIKVDTGSLDRRRLLKGAGLVLGVAASAGVAAAKDTAAADGHKPQRRGYRETEEVRTYYKSVRS